MSEKVFDRETLLDLSVNFIPLVILALFVVIFAVLSPFGFDSTITTIQFGIIGSMALGLAVLTYYAGKAVSMAESEAEAADDH
ncbi:DUF6684 family protein [Halobacteriales archaeon Cl-PHB]